METRSTPDLCSGLHRYHYIFNIAATAYEPISLPSTDFNNNVTLWYQRIIPASWTSPTWSCAPANLNLNDSISQ